MRWSRVPEVGNGSARKLRERTGSLAVGTMLSVILISSLSSAETSPRDKLEGFFGQVAAILRVAGNSKQALAERRADSIRDYLVAKGIESDRITTAAYGGRQACQEPPGCCPDDALGVTSHVRGGDV